MHSGFLSRQRAFPGQRRHREMKEKPGDKNSPRRPGSKLLCVMCSSAPPFASDLSHVSPCSDLPEIFLSFSSLLPTVLFKNQKTSPFLLRCLVRNRVQVIRSRWGTPRLLSWGSHRRRTHRVVKKQVITPPPPSTHQMN